MTDIIEEKAFAKLNISLDVKNRRPDGYHEMAMVMQTVSLCDTIKLKRTDSSGISASCSVSFIPCDDRNLAVRAARLYLNKIGCPESGIRMNIEKKIPVGAGLAGGSADAAAVLRGMNRLFSDSLSREELIELSEEIGSDVPFCLLGGTMFASGRGEILSPVRPMPECFYVICKPSFSISTPDMFRTLDRIKVKGHPDTEGILIALEEQNLAEICRRMYNVFEDIGDRRMRTVAEIKSGLLDCGAEGAVMSGTGSAVFGIFKDRETARSAAEEMKRRFPFSSCAENVESCL